MKNNFLYFILIIFFGITPLNFIHADEQFTFNITEIEISNDGNLIIGSKGGTAKTNDGYEIIAENFIYNKSKNILNVSGNVRFFDKKNIFTITSDKGTYQKIDDIILTEGNSKAESENNIITASNFKFDRTKNILTAKEDVKFFDREKNTTIKSEHVKYIKNKEIIYTLGVSSANVEKKYDFLSKNVRYDKNKQELSSKEKSTITDDDENQYIVKGFLYQIKNKLLKAKNINLITKIDKNKIDNYFFSEGFFNLDKKSFISKDTKIKVHKDVFGNKEQDPRLYGSSSSGNSSYTKINKGIFTSCKENNNCPPWSIQSDEIIHDKLKRDLIYKNAVLKIYDVPVLYFPKFFHPDPTVKRRSGFLQPQFNGSKTLGSSIFLPYFKTLGMDKDYTFKPTIFEDKFIFQNEFRKKTFNSSLIADFSLTTGYRASTDNKKKNINHLFLNYKKDLNLSDFKRSKVDLKLERVSNDTFLKVFQNNLSSSIMPEDKNLMENKLDFMLDHNDYNLSAGFEVYEKLGTKHSDRYQYVLPKYDFSRNLDFEKLTGSLNLYSSGSNNLKDTNNLRSSITNDLYYNSKNYFTDVGFKNKFNLYFKNLNSIGKNDPTYKSSPRVEGMGIFEISSSLPLVKENNLVKEILTPKISIRANPGNNMKNYSSQKKVITASNIFEINRLGIDDSFESGKSITMGIDYKLDIENKENSKNKYLEFNLATVLRDKVESEIPISSTINNKNSNLFGSINNKLFENLNLSYDFSINNNYDTFDSHSVSTELSVNNFVTEFNYIEQRNNIGSNHIISNNTKYEINDNNALLFSTRRNKEVSLTEYYDLTYQYKNDCLTAGIKYNKTFYQDNDLKPSENLFFTISLIPLTTYERKIYDN